ncbi:MAG: UDP-N-acetylmuramate--L-alanine ligase [Rhizobiaceae bacterium]
MKMPPSIGLVHFIGIGGIGMSGIAEVLHNLGYEVQGSDQAEGANVQRLREKGIKVFVGHSADNLGTAQVVVVSTAIKNSNVELIAAREHSLPIVRRAEMLAELMRFRQSVAIGGTHGKTTTTSMVATLLEAGGLDPTVINGGIINAYGTNARMGEGDWMVVEADESDGTFLKLPADAVVVTNIDPEHLDHYGSFDKVRDAFKTFVENVPFYGFAVMCIDHPEVQALVSRIEDRRIVTYGENPQADVRYFNHRMEGPVSVFDVLLRSRRGRPEVSIEGVRLPMPGKHNVSNAVAAITVANRLGISADDIRRGMASFGGVKRRFTHTGSWNGVEIFDDYAHHPVEIRAVLGAAREACTGKVIAISQPHRYTRLHDLFDEFSACYNDADTVMIAPVYPAGEDPIDGADAANLAANIRAGGHRDARDISGPEAIAPLVREIAEEGDYVLFLGAGNITQWSYALPDELAGG